MSKTVIVQKRGWEILAEMLSGGKQQLGEKVSPVVEKVKEAVLRPTIAFNPLALYPADIVLLDIEEAQEIRFVVDRARLMKRLIGNETIFSVDYILVDPTNDDVGIGLRAYDNGKGDASFTLLIPDGDKGYDEDFENALNQLEPGDPTGFPNSGEDYVGFARPQGVKKPYCADVTEYDSSREQKTYGKVYWDFVRDSSLGVDSQYLIELDKTDGFFYAYKGRNLDGESVQAFRF